jgi:hypothetical protein
VRYVGLARVYCKLLLVVSGASEGETEAGYGCACLLLGTGLLLVLYGVICNPESPTLAVSTFAEYRRRMPFA